VFVNECRSRDLIPPDEQGDTMIAALSWPEAVVHVAWISGLALVLSVLTWSIFRTGQTAIRKEFRVSEEEVEQLRGEVRRLQAQLGRPRSEAHA